MKTFENYYEYLGIPVESLDKVIRKAYKKKSLLVHPDKLKVESSEEFNKLKLIYDILSDPSKKAAYDKELTGFKNQEKYEKELTEKQRKYRELFRAKEEEEERKKREKAKERHLSSRKAQILRQDAEDMLNFSREFQAKRRKKMEEIIKEAVYGKPQESETEYTEDEVMKMMGL